MKCTLFAGVFGALLFAPSAQSQQIPFRDPLDTPAEMTARAMNSQLMAITRAGTRLIAVGQRGHIVYSDNAGKSWVQAKVPVSSDLVGVHFPSRTSGWAVGHDGVVLHSIDGGESWTRKLDGRAAASIAVTYYQQRSNGDNKKIARALDDARRFQEDGPNQPFLDVWFENEQVGYIIGAFNMIFKTEDGGVSWQPWFDRTDNEQGLHLRAIQGYGNEVFIVGERGLALRLDRAEGRFVALQTGYQGSYFGLVAKPDLVLAFGLRGNAYRSRDNGRSWAKIDTGTEANLTAGATLADGSIVISSMGGEVLVSRDNGETFTQFKAADPSPIFGISPGKANELAAVGGRGARLESLKMR
jgi:photosystem II stability/assembly factor-like uncharacterized protein